MSFRRMVITRFWIGDFVKRVLDDSVVGQIVGVTFELGGSVRYRVVWEPGPYPTKHFENELRLTHFHGSGNLGEVDDDVSCP